MLVAVCERSEHAATRLVLDLLWGTRSVSPHPRVARAARRHASRFIINEGILPKRNKKKERRRKRGGEERGRKVARRQPRILGERERERA